MKARVLSCVVGGLCCAFIGCGAPEPVHRGKANNGSGANGSGANGSGAQPNLGTGASLNVGAVGSGGAGDKCQTGGAEFTPKVPTVLLMVDRSGTMFKDTGMEPWSTLRDGVLEVVKDMAADVRFGLVAVTGEQQAGMCPLLDEVAPADSNYDALAAKYMSLGAPTKGESPGMRGLERAAEILAADTTEGEKYVLFVTDGEQDFCNDPFYACPTDSVVYHLQTLAAQGFKTFIFGLPMKDADPNAQARYPVVLQAFADAGSGLGVVPVLPAADTYYGCQGEPNWAAEATAAGRTQMQALGTYTGVSGGAPVFAPDPTNKEALKEEFAKVLSGVKSCTFDIGGDIKVVQDLLSLAHVYVQDMEVPLDRDMANGWYMPTETQIELVGEACTNWRTPGNNKIDWDFPCDIVVPK